MYLKKTKTKNKTKKHGSRCNNVFRSSSTVPRYSCVKFRSIFTKNFYIKSYPYVASSLQVHYIEFEYQQINAFYVISLELYNRNLKVTKMNMKFFLKHHAFGAIREDVLEFQVSYYI